MRKFISFLFVAIIGIISATAQDSNSIKSTTEEKVDSLTTKLNKLQHDYDYLYCSHEISLLHLELKDFINNIDIRSNAILINCYHSRFDIDLYTAYKENYNSSVDLLDSMKDKVDAVKSLIALKILSLNFTDSEIDILMNGCSFLDKCLSKAQGSIDYYKLVLDIYKDLR